MGDDPAHPGVPHEAGSPHDRPRATSACMLGGAGVAARRVTESGLACQAAGADCGRRDATDISHNSCGNVVGLRGDDTEGMLGIAARALCGLVLGLRLLPALLGRDVAPAASLTP